MKAEFPFTLDRKQHSELTWLLGYVVGLREAAKWAGAKALDDGSLEPIEMKLRGVLDIPDERGN